MVISLIFLACLPIVFAMNELNDNSVPNTITVNIVEEWFAKVDVHGDLILNVSKVYDEDTFYMVIKNTAEDQRRVFWLYDANSTIYYLAGLRFQSAENIRTEYGTILRAANGGYYGSGGKFVERLPTAGWNLWLENEEIRLSASETMHAHFTLHQLLPTEEPIEEFTLTIWVW